MKTKFGINTRVKLVGGSIRFNMDGSKISQFERRLGHFNRAANNMQPAFDEYGRYLVNTAIPRNFQREGYGRKWPALSPAYAERKRRLVGNRGILVFRGDLRDGFRWKATPRTLQIRNIVMVNGRSLYQIHQEGLGHNPKRIMVFIGAQEQRKFEAIVHEHLYGDRP